MNEIGSIISTILSFVVGIPAWLLETLGLYSQAYWLEQRAVGVGETVSGWEESLNTGIGSYVAQLNATLDSASGGLFSSLVSGMQAISGGFSAIAGYGQTMMNIPNLIAGFLSRIPRIGKEDTESSGVFDRLGDLADRLWDGVNPFGDGAPELGIEGLQALVNQLLNILELIVLGIGTIISAPFVAVGWILNNVFSVFASFFGAGAGFATFLGGLTGIQSMMILVGIFLVVYTIGRAVLALLPNSIVFSPGDTLETLNDGVITGAVGLSLVFYGFVPVAGALLLFGLGTVMFFVSETYNRGLVGIVGLSLMAIGSVAMFLGAGLGYVITFLPLAPALFVGTIWAVTYLTGDVRESIESDEPLIQI